MGWTRDLYHVTRLNLQRLSLCVSSFLDADDCRKRRHCSSLNECSTLRDDVCSKRGCFDPDVFPDHDQTGGRPTRLPHGEDRPGLDAGGHHEDLTDHPEMRRVAFSPSRSDEEPLSSLLRHHRRLPVVPRPRFPAAILSPPSLSAVFARSTPFHNVTPLTTPSFCFTPSVDYSTAVPPNGSTLPPPRPPPFAFCHPAFWGAMPYLIRRALLCGEGREDLPMSACQAPCPVENDPGLPSWRSWETQAVGRRLCGQASPSPDVGLRPRQEAASSGLEDMAKMVNRLDEAKKLMI